jgi:type II secretory pathway pseudopilin PulG
MGKIAATAMKNTNGMKIEDATRQPRKRRVAGHSERGTSLIEIMVVLVIVLIGIFLAIRVFPIGFGVLRANGDRTVATQLAENAMGAVKGDSASMPNGILYSKLQSSPLTNPPPYLQNPPYMFQVYTDVNPDGLGPCYETANSPCADVPLNPTDQPGDTSDINKFRAIQGEAVKVPLPTPIEYSAGTGSLYTVKFGPILMDTTVGNPLSAPNQNDPNSIAYYNSYLKVSGAPLSGVPEDTQGAGDNSLAPLITDEQTYLIDYADHGGTAMIMLPPRATAGRAIPRRTFNITVSYNNGTQIVTVAADPLIIADGVAAFQPITINNGMTTLSNIIPGSEVVTRNFIRIASTATFDTVDPYQYKLLSPNVVTGEAQAQANYGVIAFNPVGASFAGSTTNSEQPFMAYVDYQVLDWHIIRDDREVPSVLPITATVVGGGTVSLIPVRTTLRNIKRVGDPEVDNTFYSGMYGITPGPNTDANPKDFELFSVDRIGTLANPNANYPFGTPLTASSAYAQNGTLTVATKNAYYYMLRDVQGKPGASVNKDSSYETGVIYINVTPTTSGGSASLLKPGSNIRMLYKATGDWGVAVQKAYSRYIPAIDPATNVVSAQPLKGVYNGFAVSPTTNPAAAQLRFPFSDYNKSVLVQLQYTKPSGEVVRLAPVQVTLNQQNTDKTVDPTKYDQRYAYANVSDYIPFLNQADFQNSTSWQVVGPILGVSVKTRVIWHDNDTPNERWHVQDMDSFLNTTSIH